MFFDCLLNMFETITYFSYLEDAPARRMLAHHHRNYIFKAQVFLYIFNLYGSRDCMGGKSKEWDSLSFPKKLPAVLLGTLLRKNDQQKRAIPRLSLLDTTEAKPQTQHQDIKTCENYDLLGGSSQLVSS